MRPIPKCWLIHSCTIRTPLERDGYGEETYSEPVRLSHVRIDASRGIVITSEQIQVQLAAVLFYDCRNSRGLNGTFCLGQKVSFGGRDYTVKSIEPLYDGHRLHHYELGLV